MQKYKKRKIFPLGSEDAFTKVFDVPEFFYVFHLFALFIFAHRPYLMFFFFNCCYSYFSAPRSFIDSACFI